MKEQLYFVVPNKKGTSSSSGLVYIPSTPEFYTTDKITVARHIKEGARVFTFPQLQEIEDAVVRLFYDDTQGKTKEIL